MTCEISDEVLQSQLATSALAALSVVGPARGLPVINLKQIPTLRSREAQLHHREFAPQAGGGLVYFLSPGENE